MSLFNHVGVIGSGAASVHFLQELIEDSDIFRNIHRLTLFERRSSWGSGWVHGSDFLLDVRNPAANRTVSGIRKGRELSARFVSAFATLRRAGVEVILRGGAQVLSKAAQTVVREIFRHNQIQLRRDHPAFMMESAA